MPVRGNRYEAKQLGELRYHGRPCKHDGTTERYTRNGGCVECHMKDRSRNPERAKAREKAWRDANPEKAKAPGKRWRAANRHKINPTQNNWRHLNPDKITASNKASKRRRYSQILAENANRRARKRTRTPLWAQAPEMKSIIKKVYRDSCESGLTVDHIIPLSGCCDCEAVGLHVPANLHLLPKTINSSKRDRCLDCFVAIYHVSETQTPGVLV